ncbi:MAG TPA: family 43 glycosylhydrolase [Solirubrobacteraceae bacterium]|nr:family 43 glycosylhydrolase [Solirubrobacteraceae bacterium]
MRSCFNVPRGRRSSVLAALAAAMAALLPFAADDAAAAVVQERATEVVTEVAAGPFERIYDPSVGETSPWYINDHTFVRVPGDGWHLFGITHAEPAAPLDEDFFDHATAPQLAGPWTKRAPVLPVDPSQGEEHVWAPHVVRHAGRWWMFYSGGDADHRRYRMQLATSRDLKTWTRHPANPLFQDGFDARDPFVTRVRGRWVMYYTANERPDGGHHIVAYRTSKDLVNWSERRVAYTDPAVGTFGGPTESPFVVRRGRDWYLFVCCTGSYTGTKVLRSRDPLSFDAADVVGRIDAHAAEVVRDRGRWWISAAGWGRGGVSLAPLDFESERRSEVVRVTAPGYRAVVQTAPTAALRSLEVQVGGEWRDVLGNPGRGTLPYAGVGWFGDTDRPGAPASVESSSDGRELVLRGIRIGDEPVTVDWTFTFGDDTVDTSFTWHVAGATAAPVWEAGWSLDPAFSRFGDPGGLERAGDVSGFPAWAISYDDELTLAAAYEPGSAWAEANRWYSPADGAMSWQPLWRPGGMPLPQGTLPGGAWRLGVSPRSADVAYAQELADSLGEP